MIEGKMHGGLLEMQQLPARCPLDPENGHCADILAGTWGDTPTGKASWASRKANPPNL
jgi:hypothetical protein